MEKAAPILGRPRENDQSAYQALAFRLHNDVDELAQAPTVTELDNAGYLRKERIILAAAYVDTRLVLGATLTDDNRSSGDEFTSKRLHTQPL